MDPATRFGEHVRILRKAKGYNQEELAKLCGLKKAAISKLENGTPSEAVEWIICKLGESFERELRFVDPEIDQLLVRNLRDVTLLEGIKDVGLVDVEHRESRRHALPPAEFFEAARREISLFGISLHRAFDQYVAIIKQALEDKKRIYTLILHPDCSEARRASKVEKKDMPGEIRQVVGVIKRERLYRRPGFKIKFLKIPPLFTGVMIDGDVDPPAGELPKDNQGKIRVRPGLRYLSQDSGVIIQFEKKASGPPGAFDYFAEDLRTQWRRDGEEDPKLFAKQ